MRALRLVLGVALLMALCAASASATESYWGVSLEGAAYWTPEGPHYSRSSALAAVSSDPRIVDDPAVKDYRDGSQFPPTPDTGVCAEWWRPWASGGNWSVFSRDWRQPLSTTPGYGKRWDDLLLWAMNGVNQDYPFDSVILSVNGAGVPNTINGTPIIYSLVLTWAPADYWNDPSTKKEWVLPPFPGPLDSLSLVHWYEIILPAAGAILDSPLSGDGPLAATQIGGYRFAFVTPEPASLLGLGAGLLSLVSRMRRR